MAQKTQPRPGGRGARRADSWGRAVGCLGTAVGGPFFEIPDHPPMKNSVNPMRTIYSEERRGGKISSSNLSTHRVRRSQETTSLTKGAKWQSE